MNGQPPPEDIGGLIGKILKDALSSAHFEEFRDLGDIVKKKVLGELGDAFSQETEKKEKGKENETPTIVDVKEQQRQLKKIRKEIGRRIPEALPSSVLPLVFGAMLFAACFPIFLLTIVSLAMSLGIVTAWSTMLTGGGLLLGAGAITSGVLRIQRQHRFRRIATECYGKRFYFLSDLGRALSLEPQRLVKDIERMIRLNYLPAGHLDDPKTCLMLNEETYQQYLRTERQMKDQQKALEKKKAQKSGNTELDETLTSGREYLLRIREANRLLPGEEISKKISRIDLFTDKIFQSVEKGPQKLPELRRLMTYYLPTTLKLLDTYVRFEQTAVPGENVQKTKQEIEQALDTIGDAFQKLLDSLFEDEALDISTDISALQSMLAQEGLTGDNNFS